MFAYELRQVNMIESVLTAPQVVEYFSACYKIVPGTYIVKSALTQLENKAFFYLFRCKLHCAKRVEELSYFLLLLHIKMYLLKRF